MPCENWGKGLLFFLVGWYNSHKREIAQKKGFRYFEVATVCAKALGGCAPYDPAPPLRGKKVLGNLVP